ncbi:RNA binding protein, putative [Trypanosoma brucei gambiense DAL972]|uniref:RNA binding protein, putative n=1 Tax=Trypanosoma brucei gambiense (strain MHOM/CI/86/DAL972) TaxID=679716 RepID=D0A0T0_TRYB9|nr:RNA binding protein, putative [Trypanosoma brucei gambiense DAL972]CBH16838.1 RNA binding protein, putative [Trypanosoma brucei gambiense DAL972]|eukprot:XP_011779102.1 RNA binding protein, putative [Trypanosoma brucei gambiense DAL972]
MNYADGNYYDSQQAAGYYYPEGQQMDDGYTIDLRPPDITEQQDNIIQLVAKYVVASCDGARYQNKLMKKTKFNSYFAFLASPEHKYHEYYQYLVRSYTHWRHVAAASAANQDNNEGYAFYTEQLQQQMYDANMYYAHAYNIAAADNLAASASTVVGTATGGYYDANSAFPLHNQQPQPEPLRGKSVLGNASDAISQPLGEAESRKRTRSATPLESSDDEEEDQGVEFVMENGVARAVPRRS